ncbi:hypothetical protein DAPPUDRAFT_305412 [Daphnia pulex]|uniref:Ribosome biogenesis protein BOP1 homolog n=2 Tax=Daphnia pulex TaxID=6669 RepID=E9GSC4_DAPPU|nr:hypothetical protein DAPPUDRAFT_305412 [Daphnia pulex]|eukprot:EFX77685.1 hypothetical protein DAPPUDRAFT_305412 [Daphnia pulex]
MATASKSSKRRLEIVENNENSAEVDDIIEAQVSDNADDSTDEESSEYSGLEDDEEDDSDDEEDNSDWEEGSDEDEEEGDEVHNMSTNEDSEDDTADDKVVPTAVPITQDGPSTSTAQLPAPPVEDEYAYDSSDEEDLRNTVGNIPMNWYDDYPHIGYDLEGKAILKPKRGDEIDNFLRKMENPESWRTVYDPQTGQDVILSNEDVDLIKNVMGSRIPDGSYNPYEPWVDWFTNEVMETPVTGRPEHKRSFIPSRVEAIKVGRMVHAIKMGWIKPRVAKDTSVERHKYYLLWNADDKSEDVRRIENPIPAPKPRLPGHAESYNPPPEYTFSEREINQWNRLAETPYQRKFPFIPKRFSSLRAVPAYDRFARERFVRCLDLYLCPRAKKMRLTIQPEDLVPQLPKPRDLQPFPTVCSMIFKGHKGLVRTISHDPSGQFFISGSDDQTLKVWEIATGRCFKTFEVKGTVRCVSWCPNASIALVAAAVDNNVYLINPGVGDRLVQAKTDEILKEMPAQTDYLIPQRVRAVLTWNEPDKAQWDSGFRVTLTHFKAVKHVAWHSKGDYFSSVMPEGDNRSVLIHQLSRRRSQLPFSKSKGLVQCTLFHPLRPYLFVATQRHVRVYNLLKQELTKKLMTGAKWISSIAVHPGGDNILVGTHDRRLCWFDLDLSTKPYQALRHHGQGIRAVAYHKRYPLFASGSDDCSAIVSHGMVYNDLLKNPTIVPLKKLRGHAKFDDFGVFDVLFHPTQPWLFTSGADATIRLYT